jgi:SRSO17 transposase
MAVEAEWVEVGTGAPELGCLVSPQTVERVVDDLAKFLDRYRRLFGRRENGEHAELYVEGRLMTLERRTTEPIAKEAEVPRRALQQFVGAGQWDDALVRDQMRREIAGAFGDPDGALIADGSGFRKYGRHSVGVARQYCGRLGKVDNCQVGEFLAYTSPKGTALVDAELYLPKAWAKDGARRAAAGVPRKVTFQKNWQLALTEIKRCRAVLPHAWILADDHYGKVIAFRDTLHKWGEEYLLDVPSDRLVVRRDGQKIRVDQLAASLAPTDFLRVRTRDGLKGPIEVEAFRERVTPVRHVPRQGPMRPETLLVLRHADGKFSFHFSNAEHVPTASLAKAAAMRHYIEEILETAKGDAGMAQYEMRSWVGWHHHITLTMLATWFLVHEQHARKRGLQRSPSPWSAGPQDASCSPPS